MSQQTSANRTPEKKSFFKKAAAPYGRTQDARPYNSSRSFGSGGSGRSFGGGGQQGGRRATKRFNPSDFIKKVEEQVIAAAFTPKHMFADFNIVDQLKANIAKRGYTAPTPIQDEAIPFLLEGRDLIGSANTGTGKTAAFLIPLVNNLLTKKIRKALIITPTRELAAQIQSELAYFAERTNLSSVLCIGKLNINHQISLLRRDPAFVIGTPGRLRDLAESGYLQLKKYDAIVLDEVDTMLDMGFINDMRFVISQLPVTRQSLFFSATISKDIKEVMDSFLKDPISINVKTRQSAENVNQDIVKVSQLNKVDILHDLLIKPEFSKVLIFLATQRATDKLSKSLRERGFQIAAIHGAKTQAHRKKALGSFKSNAVKILLATDVVARGIDIDDVSHVINFDLPQTHEDYIHRIGRTGRANKIGQALTFIEAR